MGALFRLACYAAVLALGIAVAVSMVSDTPTETIAGEVTSCVTIQTRPVPAAFTVDGVKLAGEAWLSDGLGCTAEFTIKGVPVEKLGYRVVVGTMSATVSAVGADSVRLTDF